MTKNETQPGKMLAVTSTKWKQSHASTRRVAAFASNDIAGAPKSMVKQFAGRLHDILMQFAWVRGSGGCSTRESIQPILRWLSPDFIVSSYLHRGRERERERERERGRGGLGTRECCPLDYVLGQTSRIMRQRYEVYARNRFARTNDFSLSPMQLERSEFSAVRKRKYENYSTDRDVLLLLAWTIKF